MKFSIVMPYYGCFEYVGEAVQSIIDQTYKDWELIFVNDGDEEITVKPILENFHDKRIKYYYKEHSGIGDTRNFGNRKAKGDWIVVADADDLYVPYRLKGTYKKIKSGNYDVVCGGIYWVSENGKFIQEYWPPKMVTRENLLKGDQGLLHTGMAYKRQVGLDNPYRAKINDDFYFIVDIWNNKKNYKVGLINKPFSLYRALGNGVSNSNYHKIQKELKLWAKKEGGLLRRDNEFPNI